MANLTAWRHWCGCLARDRKESCEHPDFRRRPKPELTEMLLTTRSRGDATKACEESDQ